MENTVEIHLGGHLNFFDPDKRNELHVPISGEMRLSDMLELINLPSAEIALISINGEHVDLENTIVFPGDRIGFYPPMGGG
ncbi:MAG: hypothetical protein GWN61_03220 [candidate division Zixibacteria bacterium]|nr:hypothetical protein [candidate division Zixibacteria bacterium]NIR47745.1 hypothetical protein [candidate division KSB1 bacterium]NIW43976.1 hypothetical protein [Gammaproteobacteria bacterium]NIR63051.1 hypothetical protein [candidate division Zixibacteria bacterium]NIS45063.1 hypothetical protein [candidate division Zixibacteria bacterium]